MAATMQQMGFAFNTQDADIDSWIDFSSTDLQSPPPATKAQGPTLSRMPSSSVPSALTSPSTTIVGLDGNDEFQTPAKPSHEYERFKQQTGLPSGSVLGLSNGLSGFSNSGIGMDESSMMGNWGSGIGGMDDFNVDGDFAPSNVPAYFFPAGEASSSSSSQQTSFVDPSSITTEAPTNVRVWPGMHQQQAAMARAQQQAQQQRQQQILQQQQQKQRMEQQQQKQQQQQQQRPQTSKRGSHTPTDARTEQTIARLVNEMRQNSQRASAQGYDDLDNLPHVARMKKDEDDMDEDERLLASEEGKKLSSKERRQLRNKVSARAFRSRRKEYIGQLEGEVNGKAQECNDLKQQNRALMEENARYLALVEKLLRHPAFTPFLEDLSRDETIQGSVPILPQSAPALQPAPQQFQAPSQAQDVRIGMTLVPETPVDLSMLTINGNWSSQNVGFPYNQHQVFAVTEVPQGPINPINTNILSGKADETCRPEEEDVVDSIKIDYPVVERAASATETLTATKPAETEEDREFDNDPAFTLYHDSPSSASSSVVQLPSFEHITISSEKPSQFELVIQNEESAESAMARVERMCASMDTVLERIHSMTS